MLRIGRNHHLRSIKPFLPVCPALLVLLVFYFFPVFRLFYWSLFDPLFTLKNYLHFFKEPLYFNILIKTFKISLLVTGVSLILSYPVASFLSEARGKRQYLMICVVLPFWTSLLVRTYAWMVLLQMNGLLNKSLISIGIISEPIHFMYNSIGVVIGTVHVLLPFMVLPIYSVLKGIDKDLRLAAYTLGANRFQTFLKITFPLSLPGVSAGVIFVFVLALGFFITPALLGGPKVMLIASLVETQVNSLNNWGFASAIAVILLAFTIVILGLFSKMINIDRIAERSL